VAKFKLTNQAVRDLNGIWIYTLRSWSEVQAENYYNLLLEKCQLIADNPNLGKNYNSVMIGLRGLKAKKHILFYRVLNSDEIEIIRILHEQMDYHRRVVES